MFSENLNIFQIFWNIFRFSENEIFLLRRQRDWRPTCANMIPRREHAVRVFTDAFYNCVSRGHPAIIAQTQIKTSGHKLKLEDWPEGCGPPVAEHKARATAINPLSMDRSARSECAVFDGEMKTKDWFLLLQIMYFSESSNFCNSCGLNVFGLTCSNENRTRVHIQCFFELFRPKRWSEVRYPFKC